MQQDHNYLNSVILTVHSYSDKKRGEGEMGYLKPVATALCSGYVKYRQCRIPKLTHKNSTSKENENSNEFFPFLKAQIQKLFFKELVMFLWVYVCHYHREEPKILYRNRPENLICESYHLLWNRFSFFAAAVLIKGWFWFFLLPLKIRRSSRQRPRQLVIGLKSLPFSDT